MEACPQTAFINGWSKLNLLFIGKLDKKNVVYRIEHLNSRNSNAMKNHHLITQIADILMQLYPAWNPYVNELKRTIKIHLQSYRKVFEDSK